MNDRIFFKTHADINWPFDGKPNVLLDTKPYSRSEEVDPFPCYSHPEALVRAEIAHVEKTLPLPYMPQWFILSHESTCRTNGWATDNKDYAYNKEKGESKATLTPYIGMWGKRIPIMPSMTRYLIAHEYSHVVDYNLRHAMGVDSLGEEYAKVRGIEENQSYGALNWHNNIAEIFANDVRILIFNREREFWPHNVPHPTNNETYEKIMPWFKEKFKEHFKIDVQPFGMHTNEF